MQHLIAPGGHRLSLVGPWHAAQPAMGRHRAGDSNATRRHVARLAVALLAGLGVIGCVVWLTMHAGTSPRPDSMSATHRSPDAAVDWIRTNIPTGVQLLADGATPPAGYPAVSPTNAGPDWRNYSYLLTARTSAPPVEAPVAAVWRSSIAIAAFDGVQIRRILAISTPDQIQRNRDADRADRLRAGDALQINPRVTLSANAKDVLARGELDLRAGAVLTAMAEQLPVTLADIGVVAAEAAAGTPARSITVYTLDPARATRLLTGFSAPLAPDQVNVGENGAIQLHWALSVSPVPSVN